jgi:hypothetical protein
MNSSAWEIKGIRRGMLPNIMCTDQATQQEIEASMIINEIEIDPYDQDVIARIQSAASFPLSLMNETLDIIESIFCKDFDESDRPQRNIPSLFVVLNLYQRVLIILQNLQFKTISKIYDRSKRLSGTMCTTRTDITNTKEGLMRHLAMLELADDQLIM